VDAHRGADRSVARRARGGGDAPHRVGIGSHRIIASPRSFRARAPRVPPRALACVAFLEGVCPSNPFGALYPPIFFFSPATRFQNLDLDRDAFQLTATRDA
jgi:hypothetical protein